MSSPPVCIADGAICSTANAEPSSRECRPSAGCSGVVNGHSGAAGRFPCCAGERSRRWFSSMSDRWNLGVVELSVLEAMDALGARGPDRPYLKCSNFVQFLADERAITPRYSYDALCSLSQPWLLHIPLVDFHGNNGSADDAPAGPRFTEARLSPAGQAALAAERGQGPLVPLTLINGDLHADGIAPPFSPTRVIDSLLALLDNRDLRDEEIIERVGPPMSPTGCDVDCDVVALAAGERATLVWTADINHEVIDQRSVLVLSHLPPGVGEDTVIDTLAARVEAMNSDDPEWEPHHRGDWQLLMIHQLDEARAIPLADIRNETRGSASGNNTRIVCELLPGADLADCERLIAATWGVIIELDVQLGAPLPKLLRDLVDVDPEAQRAALNELSADVKSPARPQLAYESHVSYVVGGADADNEDGTFATPEAAALGQPRQLGENRRLVSLDLGDNQVQVEVDLGRHPADRVVYRCVREPNSGWRVEGSRQWFDQAPTIVAVARLSEKRVLFINVHPRVSGYELMVTEYDFASTHASHHATLEAAKAHAVDLTGRPDLDWQPWTSGEPGS
jgi:hypothetical protein